MAARTQVAATTTTTEPEAPAPTPEVHESKDTATPPRTPGQYTLPELMGSFIQKLMEDPKQLNQCYRDMQVWYNAQPLENRKELIKNTKKSLETAKLASEALYGQFIVQSQQDM